MPANQMPLNTTSSMSNHNSPIPSRFPPRRGYAGPLGVARDAAGRPGAGRVRIQGPGRERLLI
ncbi:hypothetical protein GCM10023322_59550 [Rugosimonospora acidiphila]|uniref:Uncharacterized protein n=1 Tax=Rugosimonospora acidiphila TaxID=556531 RepID=A0ABP9SGZ8_9ACTN